MILNEKDMNYVGEELLRIAKHGTQREKAILFVLHLCFFSVLSKRDQNKQEKLLARLISWTKSSTV